MFQRLKFLLTLLSCTRAYQKSALLRKHGLSRRARLVSCQKNGRNPHFVFLTDQIETNDLFLVKISIGKQQHSIIEEFDAFRTMNALKPPQSGFRYPKIFDCDSDVPFLLSEYISGATIFEILKQDGSPENRDLYLKKTLDWMRNFHAAPCKSEVTWSTDTSILWIKENIEFASIQDLKLRKFAQQLFDNLVLDAAGVLDVTMGAVLCHGDIHLGNLMWDGNELYVIDFSDLHDSIPEKDLGHLAFTFSIQNETGMLDICSQIHAQFPKLDAARLNFEAKSKAVQVLLVNFTKIKNWAELSNDSQITARKMAKILRIDHSF